MRLTGLFFPLLLALAPPLLSAQTTAPARNDDSSNTLTRQQLRACMQTEKSLRARNETLDQARAAHQQRLAESQHEAQVLDEEAGSLGDAGAEARQAYRLRKEVRNSQVDDLDQRAADLNQRTARMKADYAAYLAECESKHYLRKDKIELIRELGAPANIAPARSK